MRTHVVPVSRCFTELRQLRSIRHLVSATVFQSLVAALVLSRLALDYGLPAYLMGRLQSVQNAAARLTFRLRRCDRITDAQWRRQGVARRGTRVYRWGLCPAAFRQASRHFILLCRSSFSHFTVPYFTSTDATFLVVTAPQDRILKANFPKISVGNTPGLPLREGAGLPHPVAPPTARPLPARRTQVPHCWDLHYSFIHFL